MFHPAPSIRARVSPEADLGCISRQVLHNDDGHVDDALEGLGKELLAVGIFGTWRGRSAALSLADVVRLWKLSQKGLIYDLGTSRSS